MSDSPCKEIYFDKDYVEQALRQMGKEIQISGEGYKIDYPHYGLYHISEGEELYEIITEDYTRISIPASCSGYCFRNKSQSYGDLWYDQKLVVRIIEDPNIAADFYTIDAHIRTDNFSGESELWWNVIDPNRIDLDNIDLTTIDFEYIQNLDFGNITIELTLLNSQPALKVVCKTKGEKYKKGDIFEMLFSDGNTIRHTLTETPHHYTKDYSTKYALFKSETKKKYCEFYFTLSKEDIECLRNHSFVSARLRSKSTPSVYIWGDQDVIVTKELTSILSRRYVNAYLRVLEQNRLLLDAEDDIPSVSTTPCYVYLMIDTANGYHKIGISNKPEYRERTLQSEKPTIEKVCARQYPSRIIAEAIESALHKAFDAKRIRGEWFDLSQTDVEMIKETLK